MSVSLLNEHHLEFLNLKKETPQAHVYNCQNATLLEISCTGSNNKNVTISNKKKIAHLKMRYILFQAPLVYCSNSQTCTLYLGRLRHHTFHTLFHQI